MGEFINTLLNFFSGQDPNVKYVAIGSILLGASAGTVGCFTFLRKRALVGEAIAHAVLPGVALSFLIFHTKNPLLLLIGAFLTGWLALISMDTITSKSKIKPDAAIALVLSVFFGVGVVLLTIIQNSGMAGQAGLDKFLFGKAASLLGQDLVIFSIVSILVLALVLLFFKELFLISFDVEYAKVLGVPVRFYEFLLSTLTVLTVAIGIQAVGVVLMAALLITPAASARYWSDKLTPMLILAAIFGGFSGLGGAFISYSAPAMPTGPWIVVFISIIAIASFLLAPGKGIIPRLIFQKRHRNKILEENILKALYQLGEKNGAFKKPRGEQALYTQRQFEPRQLRMGIKRLLRKKLIAKDKEGWYLTDEGYKRGARVTRLHRLWELYLNEYVHISPDHVHEDAEGIEHVITPEIEEKLQELMNYPEKDPHQTRIPQQKQRP